MGLKDKINGVYALERLAAKDTALHRLHPLCKILATLAFIVAVLSFERHAVSRLIPFVFYPAILLPLAEAPFGAMFKRALAALPFCLFVGLSNLFLERGAAFTLGGFAVSYGLLSFVAILFRAYLCVTAALLLVATTRFTELTAQLARCHVPGAFTLMFEMTYRYIGVLFHEAANMRAAYALRGAGARGVDIRHAGGFAGSLLIRSFDRAERVYAAMQCRGYAGGHAAAARRRLRAADVGYLAAVCGLCLLFRFADFGKLIGRIL